MVEVFFFRNKILVLEGSFFYFGKSLKILLADLFSYLIYLVRALHLFNLFIMCAKYMLIMIYSSVVVSHIIKCAFCGGF